MVAVKELTSPAEETHELLFEHDTLRTVRLALEAGDSVPAHSHPETIVLFQVLEGRIDLSLDGDVHELSAGEVVQFAGDREIQPTASEAATALVVIAQGSE